jgi:hypothetical protein
VLLAYAAVLLTTPALRFLARGTANVAHETEDVMDIQSGARDALR